MSDLVVETEEGKLKGQMSTTYNNFSYFTFKGIPYAKPPIGDLRFSVTQPPEKWEGIRDATLECNICAQFCKETQTIIGDEDCLYLNVYTPKLQSCGCVKSELLPVMVFFHGGGFLFGNGTDDSVHGPDYLIDKNVVIVSINYRLGILGFLSLDQKEAPGNMGLRDQIQALKWIQKNIANFGGDPNNVTIFGVSAGGASVGYMMLSPMAEGLFHKAIAQGGSPLQHWAYNSNVKKLALNIPSLHDKTISDDVELLKYLKSLTTSELISASLLALAADEFKGGIHFGFVPTTEKVADWEPVLSDSPYQLLTRGHFNKVPYMTGFCTREGLLMVSHAAPKLDKFIQSQTFTENFPFDLSNAEKADIESILKINYLDGEKLYNEADAYAIDFFTDVDFLGGAFVSAKLIAKHNKPVYFYEFSYDGNLNYIKKCHNIQRAGACHGDEGGYMVKSAKLTGPITDDDANVRETLTTLWTNFAKYGNPTPKIDDLITATWMPFLEDRVACLVIDKPIKLKHEVYPQRMKIFEELYEKKFGGNK